MRFNRRNAARRGGSDKFRALTTPCCHETAGGRFLFSSDDSHPRGAEPEFEKKEVYYMPNAKRIAEMLHEDQRRPGRRFRRVGGRLLRSDGEGHPGAAYGDPRIVRAGGARTRSMPSPWRSRTCPRSTMLAGLFTRVRRRRCGCGCQGREDVRQTNKNLRRIKGEAMEGAQVIAAGGAIAFPSQEELLAQIAGAISGVARGLAVALNGVPSGLAQVTKAVADQKEAA